MAWTLLLGQALLWGMGRASADLGTGIDLPKPTGKALSSSDWPHDMYRYPANADIPPGKTKLPIMLFSPITEGGGFNPGWSWTVAAMMMIKAINAESSILPGFELQAVIGDSQCSRDAATGTFVKWLMSQSDWVGIVGPGCFGSSEAIANLAPVTHLMSVGQSTNPKFVDRKKYPNFFRSIVPDNDFPRGWASLCVALKWKQVFVVIGDLGTGKMEELITDFFAKASVQIRFSASLAVLSGAKVLDAIQERKTRIIVAAAWAGEIRGIMCKAYQVGVKGLIYLAYGWFGGPWWAKGNLDAQGCTTKVMTAQAQGTLQTNAQFYHPKPATELTCWPGHTAAEFANAWKAKVGGNLWDEGTTMADGICVLALTLHDLLVKQGVPLASLTPSQNMPKQQFASINSFIQSIAFQGVSADFKFIANSGDPAGSLDLIQVQGDNKVVIGTLRAGENISWLPSTPLKFADGSSVPPPDAYPNCPDSEEYHFPSEKCVGCAAGKSYVASTRSCLCSPGFKSSAKEPQNCEQCAPGTFAEGTGNVNCTACPAGTSADTKGLTECTRCSQGKFAESIGTSSCSSCQAELLGGSTLFQGALSSADCICMKDYYNGHASAGVKECVKCTEGQLCDEAGMVSPKQDKGYYIAPDQKLPDQVYLCGRLQHCPSGDIGGCASGRTGIACGTCMPNHYVADNGECHLCGGVDVMPAVVSFIFLILLLIPLYRYATSDPTRQKLTMVSIAIIMGQMATVIQLLSVFRQMSITWREPVKTVLDFFDVFTFNLDVIRIQCLFPTDDPVLSFGLSLLLFPCFVGLLGALGKAGTFCGRPGFTLDRYFNSVGLVASIIFISITTLVARPLHCLGNPNGSSSMASDAATVCWESDEHSWLAGLGFVGILMYPVTFLAVIAQITYRYPAMVRSGNLATVDWYRFLFNRFIPSCYFWGLWSQAKNLFVAFAPVIFADMPIAQVLSLECLMIISLVGSSRFMPWRTSPANNSDLGITFLMSIFILTAACLVELTPTEGADLLSYILMILILLVLMTLIGVLTYCLWRRLAPTKFGAFLCHHKEGAGSLARLFKMRLENMSASNKIFLDSDNLENLDGLFDMVRTLTRNLVILGSRMVLERPWCAGEVATAVSNLIPLRLVSLDDYAAPDKEFLEALDGLWSGPQKCMLRQFGIGIDNIRNAYLHLNTVGATPLKRFKEFAEQETVIETIARDCGLGRKKISPSGESAAQDVRIIVAGTSMDAESRCTCEVFAIMAQTKMHVVVKAIHSVQDVEKPLGTADYLVTMLSKGLLEDKQFMSILIMTEAARRAEPLELVTVLVGNDFTFPDPAFYERFEELKEVSAQTVAFLKRILGVLAPPFTPLGSWSIMNTQVDEVCKRFRQCQDAPRKYAVGGSGIKKSFVMEADVQQSTALEAEI